jgi:hypothetical protein
MFNETSGIAKSSFGNVDWVDVCFLHRVCVLGSGFRISKPELAAMLNAFIVKGRSECRIRRL